MTTGDTAELPAVPGPPDHPDLSSQEISTADGDLHQRRSRRRFVIGAVVVVLLIGAGLGTWLGTSGGSAATGLKVTTQVVKVTSGTMQRTVSASGTIEPASIANLDFGVSGKVTAVNVAVGQTVTVGQSLATVDPTALQAQLASAQASLTAAQAKLTSDEDSGASASQLASDKASVTSAQSNATTAQDNVDDATLTSTIAGTVASIDLSVGQQVSGSGSTGSGSTGSTSNAASSGGSSSFASSSTSSASSTTGSSTAQIVVVSTSSYLVNTTVDDTQVGEVKIGNQAVITPSSSTTNVYGTVSSVGLIASSSSTVASFPVTIAVTGTPSGLYAGTTATVSIVVEQINDAIEVPTASITYTGGQAAVTKVVNGQHVQQAVTTGVTANNETQITKGLAVGDQVLERVVTFSGAGGAARSLFGGGGTTGRGAGGFTGGGGFPGGGGGRFSGGGGGFGG